MPEYIIIDDLWDEPKSPFPAGSTLGKIWQQRRNAEIWAVMTDLAYVVTVSDASQVYFASGESDAWAQWLMDNAGCDGCDYWSCDCNPCREIDREPKLDQYAVTGKIPLEAYRNAWWSWRCSSCPDYCEAYGPGEWIVKDGKAVCLECASMETVDA